MRLVLSHRALAATERRWLLFPVVVCSKDSVDRDGRRLLSFPLEGSLQKSLGSGFEFTSKHRAFPVPRDPITADRLGSFETVEDDAASTEKLEGLSPMFACVVGLTKLVPDSVPRRCSGSSGLAGGHLEEEAPDWNQTVVPSGRVQR